MGKDLHGYSLISRLRTNPRTSDIPAIALTAYASSSDKGKALQAGFQVHMPKPLDPGDLLEAILGLLNLKSFEILEDRIKHDRDRSMRRPHPIFCQYVLCDKFS